ncbi:MAG: hypothetical protein J07HX64_00650 [halophilic archaeon J07HX64]|nr:MAG: hypothetical protein J07HX64_00650 [halophilic archaeon J07HX64]
MPVTFENATGALGGGVYNVTVSTAGGELTGELVVSVDPNGNNKPALDTTGDGLLNDLTGDDEFDILDVQTLFVSLDSESLRTNAELFNFAGLSATRVSIFDLQALFAELRFQNG